VRFFESRTGLKAPIYWEHAVVGTALGGEDWPRLQPAIEKEYLAALKKLEEKDAKSSENAEDRASAEKEVPRDPRMPVRARIERTKDRCLLHVGRATESIQVDTLSEALHESLTPGIYNCLVLVGPMEAFITFLGSDLLFCVDSKSGRILWHQEVWGTSYSFSVAGVPPSWHQTVFKTKDQFVVFGEGSSCFVEAFDVKTGQPAFRFSTNLWWMARSPSEHSRWWRGMWR